ncbi:MAG: DNA adenine methylase [Planctomycetota bacterium]|nr:DNA adenine methylase [Planctomycetota bacterium]MDI6787382.1 DNA adenine methylase [Planctomycetota bacterium]
MNGFGHRLKELRTERKIGIKPLSRHLGVSHTYISHIENGRATVSDRFISRVARFFKQDKDELKMLVGRMPDDVRKIFYRHPREALHFIRENFPSYQATLSTQLTIPAIATKTIADFPSTRFQGSKLKLLNWLWDNIKNLNFTSALDAFGGTGSVSYLFKTHHKSVAYNDSLRFNYIIGKALIENSSVTLDADDIDFILTKHPTIKYQSVVADNFKNIYFTDEENQWIDQTVQNIVHIKNKHKQALAYFSLFQSCIIKRPYNLFHRKNLYVRLAPVERSFGNKTTWDKPFETHFLNFVKEANNAVFDNEQSCYALNEDAFGLNNHYDLVYIDTPYMNKQGVSVDYYDFYHFLEGLTVYTDWAKQIDYESKHHRLKPRYSVWSDRKAIHQAFQKLFHRFRDSIIVVSYRNDGIPSEDELVRMLKEVKRKVTLVSYGPYKYVLSKNGESKEILLIGE